MDMKYVVNIFFEEGWERSIEEPTLSDAEMTAEAYRTLGADVSIQKIIAGVR